MIWAISLIWFGALFFCIYRELHVICCLSVIYREHLSNVHPLIEILRLTILTNVRQYKMVFEKRIYLDD